MKRYSTSTGDDLKYGSHSRYRGQMWQKASRPVASGTFWVPTRLGTVRRWQRDFKCVPAEGLLGARAPRPSLVLGLALRALNVAARRRGQIDWGMVVVDSHWNEMQSFEQAIPTSGSAFLPSGPLPNA
jgi:hypothetical protein